MPEAGVVDGFSNEYKGWQTTWAMNLSSAKDCNRAPADKCMDYRTRKVYCVAIHFGRA